MASGLRLLSFFEGRMRHRRGGGIHTDSMVILVSSGRSVEGSDQHSKERPD